MPHVCIAHSAFFQLVYPSAQRTDQRRAGEIARRVIPIAGIAVRARHTRAAIAAIQFIPSLIVVVLTNPEIALAPGAGHSAFFQITVSKTSSSEMGYTCDGDLCFWHFQQ